MCELLETHEKIKPSIEKHDLSSLPYIAPILYAIAKYLTAGTMKRNVFRVAAIVNSPSIVWTMHHTGFAPSAVKVVQPDLA